MGGPLWVFFVADLSRDSGVWHRMCCFIGHRSIEVLDNLGRSYSKMEDKRESQMKKNGRRTITEVALAVGVTPKTIMRWERAGKVGVPKRDWRGWRVYDEMDVERLKTFFEATYDSWRETPYATAS